MSAIAPATDPATRQVAITLIAFTSSRLPGTFRNLIIPCSGRTTKPHRAANASICPSTSRRNGLKTLHVNRKIEAVTIQLYRLDATA